MPYDELFGARRRQRPSTMRQPARHAERGDTVIVLKPDDYYIEVTAGDTMQWV
jgi:hypothetical protein